MKKTNTTASTMKLGQAVRWKSSANGITKAKTGKIVGIVKAGAKPNLAKFKGLRFAGKKITTTRFVIDVKGKFYMPHTGVLNLA